MTGHRTSLYIPADLTAAAGAAKKAGRTLTDVLRSGFAAEGFTDSPVTRDELRADLAEALAPILAALQPPCPHPKARIFKGLCGACGQHVS